MARRKRIVQVYNPKTKRWVKVDRKTGRIISQKKSTGPYKKITKYRGKKKK